MSNARPLVLLMFAFASWLEPDAQVEEQEPSFDVILGEARHALAVWQQLH